VYEPNILLSLELRGRAYFEKGIAYPQKLSERTSVKDSKLGFFDWLERKEERKERQLERLHAQNEELLEGMKIWKGVKNVLQRSWDWSIMKRMMIVSSPFRSYVYNRVI